MSILHCSYISLCCPKDVWLLVSAINLRGYICPWFCLGLILLAYASWDSDVCTIRSVSQSVDYIFSSHLGLIRCLILIVRISTQHDMSMPPGFPQSTVGASGHTPHSRKGAQPQLSQAHGQEARRSRLCSAHSSSKVTSHLEY